MDDFRSETGIRIKSARINRGLTREKLSEIAQISDKFLYDIENGKKGMSAKTLRSISVALEVSADWLLGIEKEQS